MRREGLQPDATPEQVRNQLTWTRGELAGARRTIQHMSRAMSWISGHDRQGLDHLEEAVREGRGREAAVRQARRWAARARATEAALAALADQLAADQAHSIATDPARHIRTILDQAKEA